MEFSIEEQKIIELYNQINLGHCEICLECKRNNSKLYDRAVGMWFVGKYYANQEKRLLFVGKNARGVPAIKYEENVNDKGYLNEFRYARENLWNKSWAYWNYSRIISEQLYGEAGYENVAFTNIIKCNGSDTIDTTNDNMKDYCVKKLNVLRKEIQIIKPTHIVFYTSYYYDQWIPFVFDELRAEVSTSVTIGKKQMPWAEYDGKIDSQEIHVLRVGHPERMKKADFVTSICDWVKRN